MDPFSWTSLIQPAAQAVFGLGSNMLNNNQQNAVAREGLAQNQSQFNTNLAMKQSEMARRNQMAAAAAPAMFRDLGYRDPAKIAELQQQVGRQPAAALGAPGGGNQLSGTGANGSYMPNAIQGPTTGEKVTGALLGGKVGIGLTNKIGLGRRTADSFVKGVENPFGQQDLPKIVQMKDAGDIEGAKSLFNQAYAAYKQAAQSAIARGGNEATVAQQSLTNPSLQRTIQTIAQSLGVSLG